MYEEGNLTLEDSRPGHGTKNGIECVLSWMSFTNYLLTVQLNFRLLS